MGLTVSIPTMASAQHHATIGELAAGFRGWGAIVECGVYLGATTLTVSEAIGTTAAEFHCYDNFAPNDYEKTLALENQVILPDDSRDWIRQNVISQMPDAHVVHLHQGRLRKAKWCGKPIELFILDGGKTDPTFSHVIDTFAPYWKAGTVVCLLDAYFSTAEQYLCQRRWLEANFPNHSRVESGAFFVA